MKITSAEVVVTCPGRNFVSLRLETEDGVVGWGDATLNGRELAVASYLRDQVNPVLLGRDARAIEDTWQYLYRGSYWRRGPVTMAADTAKDLVIINIAVALPQSLVPFAAPALIALGGYPALYLTLAALGLLGAAAILRVPEVGREHIPGRSAPITRV